MVDQVTRAELEPDRVVTLHVPLADRVVNGIGVSFVYCENGYPPLVGDLCLNRATHRGWTIRILFGAYECTRVQADYVAALSVYNYAVTTLPARYVTGPLNTFLSVLIPAPAPTP